MKLRLVLILLFFWGISHCQQLEIVDFISVKAHINPIVSEKKIVGDVTYTFQVLKKCDSVYLDARGIILLNKNKNKGIKLSSELNKIWFVSKFKPNKVYTVSFTYEATPRKALYFINDQIWTQGQGKYTSNWLPSIDDMNDKIEFDLSVNAPLDKTVVANGILITVIDKGTYRNWVFDMEKPMSSYLVAFAMGDFLEKEDHTNSGIPLKMYIDKKDALKFEPTYRHTKILFEFLEKEIGYEYPWQNYKQVPVKDFLYAGMENTSATFFSDAFVVDSIGFTDRNYITVNAHEMAHQWFGNLVTEASGTDHWLHEGFATYYALLAEKEIFGEDYYYWKLFQSAEQLKSLSDEGKGESLTNPKASSITFYEKGAWALHILKEIVGEAAFKAAIVNYLNNYKFKNVTTSDFLYEIEIASEKDISTFKKDWIDQSAFKAEQAYQSLMKSSFINEYLKISALRETKISLKTQELEKALVLKNDFIAQEVVYQLQGKPLLLTLPIYKKTFATNNVYSRQVIALSLSKVPIELKTEYETLLTDSSYVTQEAALGNLWVSFPDNKAYYLDLMDGVQGFNDKNIRQFWLFLALLTEGYNSKLKPVYLAELKQYTSSKYNNGVRKIAIEYIDYLNIWDDESLLNLIDACQHHYWRFQKSSKSVLSVLLKDETYRNKIKILGKGLDETSSKFINRMLNE